ncbi:MAG: hypothetical protein WA751_00230 [Candidatus Dormiibacterota bacterium]
MPGMGRLGTPTAGDFYLYLVLDLMIVAGLVWLALSWKLGLPGPDSPGPRAGRLLGSRARLFLRRGLGTFWIIDGLLQAQPLMATRFASLVIAPVVHGQPSWFAQLLRLEIQLWQARPLDLAVTTVLVQVGLGLAILAGGDTRLGRLGLWLSIGWALAVWVGGEALGGMLATGASEVTGAPGAVLLYATAAALLLAPGRLWISGAIPRGIRRGTGVFFLMGAILQALPFEGFWTGGHLHTAFLEMARMPQPHWLSAPIYALANLGQSHSTLLNAILVAIMATLGVGLITGRAPRAWSGLALVWLATTWWLGQGLGGVGTGIATDPNLSPLVALLLVSAWLRTQPAPVPARVVPETASGQAIRRKLALSGLAALVVGAVPAVVGLPLATLETASHSASSSSAAVTASSVHSGPQFVVSGQPAGAPAFTEEGQLR